MIHPTTKAQLISRMRQGHQEFYTLLSRIPDEHMDEIALYDNWSIKDFIAHIGWWQQTASERTASVLRGEQPDLPSGTPEMNAEVKGLYRDKSLNEIRVMESRAFNALEAQVGATPSDDIFTAGRFPSTGDDPLLVWIADSSYAHYAEHLPDVRAWMRQNGLD